MKYDPIPSIAYQVAKESWLLCFDEFQVTDIADAMLLRRLLQEFFNNGVVLVTTSNRHPNELYKNGIQRESFLPAIALLQKRCRLFNLESGQDYRKQGILILLSAKTCQSILFAFGFKNQSRNG